MAYGRMIANKIGCNKAVHELSSDTSRLAYTWTLPHLDRDGRVHGNPEILRAVVFPRREDITNDMMRSFIEEWAIGGLVEIYDIGGDWMLLFPKFRENQRNMHYDREPKSELPDPATCKLVHPEDIRKTSGGLPAQVKLREVKIREVNTTAVGTSVERTDPLYHLVWDAMLCKNDNVFPNWKQEGESTKRLVKRAREREKAAPGASAEEILRGMMSQFWKLKQGGDKFIGKHPFLPSRLLALWADVLESMRADTVSPELLAIINGGVK